ncbi:hypothetical protein [Paenibacillus alvei]|uniref:hypothetical protein n=1 Tax=Paenibacillus alvei TaxID=44250 RepID=UPI0022824E41|nr:hypothetical protein [Paenibacillus alvei]
MNNTVIKRIAADLRVRRVPDEKQEYFYSRIVYSALSMWIRYSTLDEDIFDHSVEKIGMSKRYILNKCQTFVDNMIELYPCIESWFYPEKQDTNPTEIVRNRLHQCGELVDVGFFTDVALPDYEECSINEKVRIIRGIPSEGLYRMTGLAQLKVSEKENHNSVHLFNFYGLRDKSAISLLDEYLKLAKWNKRTTINGHIFNKYSMKSFSNSWESSCILKEHDITIYRNPMHQKGNRDYSFMKKVNNCIYVSQINEYLINQYEIRRFMYGLKGKANNPVRATYKRYDDKKIVELNLFNGLPTREESILFLLGWPMNNINDKNNLLFNNDVWEFVRKMLSNLNIKLEEIANG